MKTISISPKEMAAATAPEDRFVFVKLNFAERPNEGAHSSQASLQQILRVAVRIIVADLQGEPGSFIVTENPVELIDPDGKETKRKGYLGIPFAVDWRHVAAPQLEKCEMGTAPEMLCASA